MSKARWTADQFKKASLIETTPGNFVPGERLVQKGKVDKLPSYAEAIVKAEKERRNAEPNKKYVHYEAVRPPTAEEFMKQVQEQGFMYITSEPCLYPLTLPSGELLNIKHEFNIRGCPAPRMVKGDQYKTDPFHPDPKKRQRKPVTRYFAWRDAFRALCSQKGYILGDVLRVLFIMPVPKYLSRKKREMRLGQPHKQRPDTDNMIKSIKDSFGVDDGYVWDERGIKIWGEEAKILIF